MSENAFDKIRGDKALEKDLNSATSYADIKSLLENAAARSGIAERDPVSGRFVRSENPPANQPEAEAEEQEVTKSVTVAGREFTFTGTPLEVEKAIENVYAVAVTAHSQAVAAEPRPRTDLDTIADPIKNAVYDIMRQTGFDPQVAGQQQFEQSWADATSSFLNSEAGAGWPGGTRNLELAGQWIQAHGQMDAQDKSAVLAEMFNDLRTKRLLFESDQDAEALTTTMTPQEIVESWKNSQPDAEAANQNFLDTFQNGRTSGLFGK